jgi:hypothetical protein
MPPTRKFCTIRGSNANYKTAFYTTKERRDAAAQRDADKDGQSVITELWDESHPQDGLNRGWACDGEATPTTKRSPKVEIVHGRDPDSECEITVFVDGERVSDVYVEDIDPGRGYDRSTWDERIADMRDNANLTEGFRTLAVDTLEAFSGSKYIEED